MINDKKIPEIRFSGFTDAWEQCRLESEFEKVNERNDGSFGKERWISVAKMYFQAPEKVQSNNIDTRTYVMREGDIAFEGHPNSEFQFGRFVANDIGDGVVSELFPIYRHKRNYDNNYWKHAIQIERVMAPIFSKSITSSGNSSNKLDPKHFLRQKIYVPKLEEQQKIGSFFANLDSLITLHQRECDLLLKTKKSYLQKMFPKNGEDKPEIRFVGFNDAWEQREFGELLKEFSIKSKVEDEHTVLSSTNSGMEVRDGRVSGTSNLGYKIIENGDLVLSPQNLWIGNINVNDIGIGLVSPSYKTFKFVSVFGSFIEPQLRMPRLMEKYKNASTQGASVVRRNLELDSFYQITIRVPKSDEQRKIGDFFRQLDDLITLHQRELNSLKNMKKSLLQQMFI